jgi:hypothetical protein
MNTVINIRSEVLAALYFGRFIISELILNQNRPDTLMGQVRRR